MKIGKYFSILSILITLFFLVQKISFDVDTYNFVSERLKNSNKSPTLVAGSIKAMLIYTIPITIALILSIIGLKRKNKFRILAFVFNLLTLIYLLIPLGVLFASSF